MEVSPIDTTHVRSRKKRNIGKKIFQGRYVYLMFLPVFVYFLVFAYLPMYGIVIAFQDFRPGMSFFEDARWVGFENFQIFFESPLSNRAIRNTVVLNLWELAFAFPAPIIFALLLNEVHTRWFKRTVQTISYIPHFVSLVVVIGILRNILSSEGLLNTLIYYLSGSPDDFRPTLWLNISRYFRPIYVISGIWQGIGWGSIIYVSAIAGLDQELYEAAEIDGAGRFRKISSVTLPGILPTISIMLIFAIGGLMGGGFEKLILLYQPSTYDVADTIATYMYRVGLEESKYSLSTAVGLFQTLINFALLILANYSSRRLSENSLW